MAVDTGPAHSSGVIGQPGIIPSRLSNEERLSLKISGVIAELKQYRDEVG